MDVRIADTVYDEGQRPWRDSINDLVDYKRVFAVGDGERKKVAQAMISQNPVTPRDEIKQNMTTRKLPPRFGYNDSELTISEVLRNAIQQEADVAEWNNFSGSNGEINSTNRPSVGWW